MWLCFKGDGAGSIGIQPDSNDPNRATHQYAFACHGYPAPTYSYPNSDEHQYSNPLADRHTHPD
jgi:hypothetical protein